MTWKVVYFPKVVKELRKLPFEDYKRILKKIDDVKENPFIYLERLVGSPDFRFRVGNYRILTRVVNDKLILMIIKIQKRSRVYQ